MPDREKRALAWLKDQTKTKEMITLKPLVNDASFRRYFRVFLRDRTYILMDAPPPQETLTHFIDVDQRLQAQGLLVPTIHGVDTTQGFALIDDFGDTLLLHGLNETNVHQRYGQAIATLIAMQRTSTTQLPVFDTVHIHKELQIFVDWFLQAYLGLDLSPADQDLLRQHFDYLSKIIQDQPQTFVHRDYHSRNLMLVDHQQTSIRPLWKGAAKEQVLGGTAHRTAVYTPVHEDSSTVPTTQLPFAVAFPERSIGLIDFQDAVYGPVGYDLASLIKDCYIQWPDKMVLSWVQTFYEQSPLAQLVSLQDFTKGFELTGLQRHLKVLGIFARLSLRDKKDQYLRNLPLTLTYVLDCLERYDELHPLYHFFQERVRLP